MESKEMYGKGYEENHIQHITFRLQIYIANLFVLTNILKGGFRSFILGLSYANFLSRIQKLPLKFERICFLRLKGRKTALL